MFIVEDDATMGGAIREIVKKMGFQALLFNNPTEAQNQFRIQGAHLLIVDCLIPKMSGVDLAQKLKTESAPGVKVPLILISGIFKDKTFVRDAIQKTGAVAFLTKPFNMSELQALITKHLEQHIEEESPIENLLTSQMSPVEKVQQVNALGSIEAYDIPWVSCLLMQASTSGILRLENEKSKAAIHFSKGTIVQVDMQNPESFFGALLIEGGFLTPNSWTKRCKRRARKNWANAWSTSICSLLTSSTLRMRNKPRFVFHALSPTSLTTCRSKKETFRRVRPRSTLKVLRLS